jgi:hypothetical protein
MKSYKTVTTALGIVLSLTLCSSGIKAQAGIAQNINIIPQPASVTKGVGEFVLRSAQGVTFNDRSLMGQAKYLKSELYSLNKIQLQVGKSTNHGLKLILSKQKATEGSYQLVISNHSISI